MVSSLELLYEKLNQTNYNYDKEEGIIDQFEGIVSQHSSSAAVTYKNITLTYQELDDISDQIAGNLLQAGIQRGTRIGIYMEKSEKVLCIILGVLKAGCTYVPMSIIYPPLRLQHMIKICQIMHVVTDQKEALLSESVKWNYYESLQNEPKKRLEKKGAKGQDIAYIIFTSGTTGVPKGIKIKNTSVLNLVRGMSERIPDSENIKTISLFAPIVFDMSVFQIYYALLTGKHLVIVPDSYKDYPEKVLALYQEAAVNLIDITPQYLNIICDWIRINQWQHQLPKIVISSGEALTSKIVDKFFQLQNAEESCILNSYGPTETCVYASTYLLTKERFYNNQKIIYIGKPLANYSVYIYNTDTMKLCGIEQEGELFIGGDGVAEGYQGQPELTAELFSKNRIGKQEIVYRTGDIVKLDRTGEIVCLGRKDHQVKIRGYRIELQEIEMQMNQIEEISISKVLYEKENENEFLIAYYQNTMPITESDIVEHLKTVLPEYMIPKYFVKVNGFELNINGKLDRTKLPDYHVTREKEAEEMGELEKQLLMLVQDLTGTREVYLSDNFFDIGGNSLLAMSFLMQIYKEWKVSFDIKKLFTIKTIRDIAELIKKDAFSEKKKKNVSQVKRTRADVTCLQKAFILMEEKNERRRKAYPKRTVPLLNITFLVTMNLRLDPEKAEKAIQKVVENQDMLRTTFEKKEGKFQMLLHEECPKEYFRFIRKLGKLEPEKMKSYIRKFEEGKLPLFHFYLFENEEGSQKIFLDVHHGIFDYSSAQILLDTFFAYYNGKQQVSNGENFYQYVEEYWKQGLIKNRMYWQNYFADREETAYFPYRKNNRRNSLVRVKPEDIYREFTFTIQGKTFDKIKRSCKLMGITEFLLLLNEFAFLLGKYSGLKDVCLGTFVIGRNAERIFQMQEIGLFTHLLPVRVKLDETQTIQEYFANTKQEFLQELSHQDYDYDEIYRYMEMNELEKGKVFSVIFNFVYEIKGDIEGIKYTAEEVNDEPDEDEILVIKGFAFDDKFVFKIKYVERFYDKQFIENLIKDYRKLIDLINDNVSFNVPLNELKFRISE